MAKVAITKCDEYDLDLVKEKIKYTLDLLGGLNYLVKENSKVFLKLNCLGPFEKSMGITTHPIFVQAIIQIIKERTNDILIGDNPATKDLVYSLKKNGIYEVIEAEGIKIFDGTFSKTINNPTYKIYANFEVSEQMLDCDVFINLPKLKTHALMYMSVAQKNLFGLIYGLKKAEWHVRAKTALEFADALNDLYGAILNEFKNKTMLHICDGILGLEGEGPSTAGRPINSKIILTSLDAISLDRVALEVVKLDYQKYILNIIANKRGYGVGSIDDIEILGAKMTDFYDLKFIEPLNPLSIFSVRYLRFKFIRNLVLEHPLIDHNLCIRCGECVKICPPKTMKIKNNNFPSLTNNQCIRCWCCAEVCSKSAIKKSKRPLIGRIILKNKI